MELLERASFLRTLAEFASSAAPTVTVIEDVHWADEATWTC